MFRKKLYDDFFNGPSIVSRIFCFFYTVFCNIILRKIPIIVMFVNPVKHFTSEYVGSLLNEVIFPSAIFCAEK